MKSLIFRKYFLHYHARKLLALAFTGKNNKAKTEVELDKINHFLLHGDVLCKIKRALKDFGPFLQYFNLGILKSWAL